MGRDEPVPGRVKIEYAFIEAGLHSLKWLCSDRVRIYSTSSHRCPVNLHNSFAYAFSQHRKARSWFIVLNSRHHASPYCCSLSRGRHCYDDGEQLFAPWWARDTSSDHCLFLIYCFPAGCPSCLCWGILRYLPRRVASLGRLLYFVGMYYLPRRK